MDTIIAAETAEAARASVMPPPTYSAATTGAAAKGAAPNGATPNGAATNGAAPIGSQPQLNGHRKDGFALRHESLKRQTTKVLSHLPHRDPVELEFSDLSYTVSVGFRKGQKKILHDINGRFCPSQLIAIMGPSGAGKSSLLDILSGYRITGVQGEVSVNNRTRSLDTFRRMSCYIQQDDRLQALLTVGENMILAAQLKLGKSVPREEHEPIVDEILGTLGLKVHKNTKTGRLSGGQKKRLSIALELINNPLLMFLDEPTTGLDSASTNQCVSLLQLLAHQGRTIVCTIHQPSASLFQAFDHVYVLAKGRCLYQGASSKMVPYLAAVGLPCHVYHNPADYVIELASGEYGDDKIDILVAGTENGKSTSWFESYCPIKQEKRLSEARRLSTELFPNMTEMSGRIHQHSMQETSQINQLKVLLHRGYIKSKRDTTMTYMRFFVNAIVGMLLGILFWQSGNEGSRVLENWNLLFSILIHHMMTTMMLTVLTFPTEMQILRKEHFNRWYSLKSYYISVNILEIPVSLVCCAVFTVLVYYMSAQPPDWYRFGLFFLISLLVVLIAQTFGLLVGAVFSVVNGTFLAPTMSVPMMMFAGFGVSLRDMPKYLYWGTYTSYLRFGLEGYVGTIYGYNRSTLGCTKEPYCHYRYPKKFLNEVAMDPTQVPYDIIALTCMVVILRGVVYPLLRWKLFAMR